MTWKEATEMDNDHKVGSGRGKSCWDCAYQQIAGDTFLGRCTWFSKHKREKDKEIPPEVVDIGCKHFVRRGD